VTPSEENAGRAAGAAKNDQASRGRRADDDVPFGVRLPVAGLDADQRDAGSIAAGALLVVRHQQRPDDYRIELIDRSGNDAGISRTIGVMCAGRALGTTAGCPVESGRQAACYVPRLRPLSQSRRR
jgi:hypothetical protein